MTAITRKESRRRLDQYFSPTWATQQMLLHVPVRGVVLECCAGDGAIVQPLKSQPAVTKVITNDIDSALAEKHWWDCDYDASYPFFWTGLKEQHGPIDWVVTNPPFNLAHEIIPLAMKHAREGVCALLRLSWLEPCENRVEFLRANEMKRLIVTPRLSFSGDDKTDSVTTAWMAWGKLKPQPPIILARQVTQKKITGLLP